MRINCNKWLANTAHELGAAMGLKNDLGQVGDLVDIFDFHIDEQQCQQYDRNAKRCCLFSMQTRRYFKSSITTGAARARTAERGAATNCL